MTHYRLYHLRPDGRFMPAVDLECADDRAAIDRAEEGAPPEGFELWSGSRLVVSRRALDGE